MYVADTWTRVMKFDVRNGTNAVPLWRYDPKITRSRTNRGIAMYGDKIIVSTNDMRLIALKKDSGELAWEVNAAAPTDPATCTPSPRTQGFTGAPLAVKTAGGKELIIQGESTGGQLGTRSWVGAFEVGTGKLAWRTFTISRARRTGIGDLEGQSQCLARRRRRRCSTASYRSRHQSPLSRHRRRLSELRSAVPPRRQSLHRQHHCARRRHRQDPLVLPGDAERALGLRHAEPQDAL